MKEKVRDSLILIGQVLAHAKHLKKVITPVIISYMNHVERQALSQGETQKSVDNLITLGKEKYKRKLFEEEKYGQITRTVKYLV